MTHAFTLVIGGARSGKSAFAEQLVLQQVAAKSASFSPVYIATARAWDNEMSERISLHRAARDGQGWQTLEAPLGLDEALLALPSGTPVLIDCLTLWLTNHMMAEADLNAQCGKLANAITAYDGPVTAVANEVGLGIVPENAMARRFRDAAGRLNQDLAAQADRVVFIAAGLPMVLKGQL